MVGKPNEASPMHLPKLAVMGEWLENQMKLPGAAWEPI
jgi:hypothetical protein